MSNGKGSAPRKGANNSAYWQNYENIFGRKTWMEWSKQLNVVILDPDGFDRLNPDKKLSREEFDHGFVRSTVIYSPNLSPKDV